MGHKGVLSHHSQTVLADKKTPRYIALSQSFVNTGKGLCMKPERIKALIDLMAESNLSELCLNEDGTQLRLLREFGDTKHAIHSPVPDALPAPTDYTAAGTPLVVAEASNVHEATAPLYGIVHFTPAPGEPPFIEVGDRIEVDQTLALLEAMKMFHPLKAKVGGIVEAILVANGSEVATGQALVRIA